LGNKNKKAVSVVTAAQLTGTITVGHFKEDTGSALLDKYIKRVREMNKRTAHEYYLRLTNFRDFIIRKYNTTPGAETDFQTGEVVPGKYKTRYSFECYNIRVFAKECPRRIHIMIMCT
jgi:hypothetical protein